MKIKNTTTSFESPITSPKIKKLERILEKRRNEKPLEQKIREKEEFLETLVYGFDYKKTKKSNK